MERVDVRRLTGNLQARCAETRGDVLRSALGVRRATQRYKQSEPRRTALETRPKRRLKPD